MDRDTLRGTVTEFDDGRGLGSLVSDDGREWSFHVIEIADGTRTIDIGRSVVFRPLPRFGRLQAGRIHKP
jgi:cold shock CspA family protein